MTLVTDDDMRERMSQAKEYCVVILKAGPKTGIEPGAVIGVTD